MRVAPEPQWEERVEEIEGEEPELSVPAKPVDHLITSGHRNLAVREAVRQFLGPLVERKNRAERNGFLDRSRFPLMSTCNLIEAILTDAMEHRLEGIPAAVIRVLSGYWNLLCDERFYNLMPHLGSCERAYTEPEDESRWDPLDRQKYAAMYRVVYDFVRSADALVAAGEDPAGRPAEAILAEHWYQHCSKDFVPADLRELVDTHVHKVGEFVYPLLVLLHRLAEDPILVLTGQHKPRVRVRYVTHPQRSYQDVQNELAVQLANLPRFTAYASIQGEQHQIRLHPPVEADIDEERIEQIRASSKARFGRPPGSPEQPASGRIPERTTEPPVRPRITREHPDEE